MRRFAPFLDLSSYSLKHLPADAFASLSVLLLAIPQGVAYAMIAGLPPAMGLYACGIPVVIGGLFRSSRHVVTGPTNAFLFVGDSYGIYGINATFNFTFVGFMRYSLVRYS